MEDDHFISPDQIRAAFDSAAKEYDKHAVLQRTVLAHLMERLELIRLNGDTLLDLGAGTGGGGKLLRKRFKKATIIAADISHGMLLHSANRGILSGRKHYRVCTDAHLLPFTDSLFELVFTNLMLQWSSDVDRVFGEIRRVLRPGGLVVFSSFAPATLQELRQSWNRVDDRIHVNAFYDVHDLGDALVRAGLSEAVLDTENIVVQYARCRDLLMDLKKIGAGNRVHGRRRTLTGKQRFRDMMNAYEARRSDDGLPATYEIVYGHAWNAGDGPDQSAVGGEHIVPLEQVTRSLRSR